MNTTQNTDTEVVAFPEGPMIAATTTVVTALTVGRHPGTVKSARIARTSGGSKYFEMIVQLDSGITTTYEKFLTSKEKDPIIKAAKEDKMLGFLQEQLTQAFGLTTYTRDDIKSIIERKCVLACDVDTYKGKSVVKPQFINHFNEDADFDLARPVDRNAETPAAEIAF